MMTIPNDELNRWWIEVADQNPMLRNNIRPALLALIAFSPDREPELAGSVFVIAGESKFAIILTAKHVLTEGITRTQRPLPAHAPSSLFVSRKQTQPSIDPKKFRVVWMGENDAAMLNVVDVEYADTFDIASLVVSPQETDLGLFRPTSLPIEAVVPNEGNVVYMLSHSKMMVSEKVAAGELTPHHAIISITKHISIRVGVVTGVYPQGYRQYRWPCFTTSIPAEPGMSGGLVVTPIAEKTIAACGIVCADDSTPEARSDFHKKGESVIGCSWPALALKVPESIPSTPTTVRRSLHDMMRLGRVPMATGGIERIAIKDIEGGSCITLE